MSYPDYIDHEGRVWRYGTDYRGIAGYMVDNDYAIAWPLHSDNTLQSFEYACMLWDLRPVNKRFVLVIYDSVVDTEWAEGPYEEKIAMARRNTLWDDTPSTYSVQMVAYREETA